MVIITVLEGTEYLFVQPAAHFLRDTCNLKGATALIHPPMC